MSYQVTIEFSCDKHGDHRNKIEYLVTTSKREFSDYNEALSFFEECTEPITTLSELTPKKVKSLKPFVDFE